MAMIFLAISAQSRADTVGVPLDDVLSDIQKVLIKVHDAADVEALPTMTAVDLVLRTELSKKADGTLELYIVKAGANITNGSVQEIRLRLGPPRANDRAPVAATAAPLADAIISAARGVKNAATRDPPLHLIKLEASIEFTVEEEATGSVGFHILPVTANIGGKINHDTAQKITITFEEKP